MKLINDFFEELFGAIGALIVVVVLFAWTITIASLPFYLLAKLWMN